MNELLEHEKKKEGFEETWFIFPTPLSHSTLRRRADDAMLAAGLKHITIHGFRLPYVKLTTKKFATFFENFRATA